MTVSQTLLFVVQIWGVVGAVVALVFLTIGIGRIDEDAQSAITFRALLVPGILVIWPLVLWRWWVLETDRDQWPLRHAPPRRSHGTVSIMMAILIAITLATSFGIRQEWPAGIEPVQLQKGAGQ